MVTVRMAERKRGYLSSYNDYSICSQQYVVIDTELTGLDEQKDSIISIGALKMDGRRIELGNAFHRLVKPKSHMSSESVVIHGITPSEVEKKPAIESVLREFLDFCGLNIIVGHFVSIDLSFINKEVSKVLGSILRNPVLDTCLIYEFLKKKYPRRECFVSYAGDSELYELARRFGIPFTGAHDALIDAFITAQLFQRFIPLLIGAGIRRIGDLISFGNPFSGDVRYRLSGEIANF